MLFTESIVIAASPDRVWKLVGTPECWSQFDDKVEGCELVGSQGGRIGSVYAVSRRMGAKTTSSRCKIVDLQPGTMIQVQEEMVLDANKPVHSGVLTYALDDLGTGTKVTLRAEICFAQLNIFIRALIWFISRFGYASGETPLMKLKRIVEAEGSLKPAKPARTTVLDDSGGFKFVDFPFWVGAVAFPASLFLLYKFVVHLNGGGDLQHSYGTLAGAAIAALVGALATKRSVFEFDVSRRQVVWSKTGMFGRRGGTIPFEKIRSAKVEQTTSGASFSYRVSLSTEDGAIPLTDAYSAGQVSKERCQQLSDRINNLDLGVGSKTR